MNVFVFLKKGWNWQDKFSIRSFLQRMVHVGRLHDIYSLNVQHIISMIEHIKL